MELNSAAPQQKKPNRRAHAFKPGQSGNPAGRQAGVPNKVTRTAKAICQGLLESDEYRASVVKRIAAGKLAPPVECMLWHYAYGKPKETHELQGEFILRWLSGAEDEPPEDAHEGELLGNAALPAKTE